MLRLFVGLDLPRPLKQRLDLMRGGIPGAKWTDIADYHITLAFIGEVDEGAAADIDEALSDLSAEHFSLSLAGADSFSQGDHPEVLWLGVAPEEKLFILQEKVARALDAARIDFPRRKKYTPHVTLARLKHVDRPRLAAFLSDHALFSSGSFDIDGFHLFQSHSGGHGPKYEILRTYALKHDS